MKDQGIDRDHQQVEAIYQKQAFEICVRVDRAFAVLMGIQWLGCFLLGTFLTPHTWIGQFGGALENGLLGIIFGGLFALPPIYWVIHQPGQKTTRHIIAIAQMCFSSLLIYLCGGRMEVHFHIFVSLAALAFYKDISVLWAATGVVVADHAIRGFFLPLSVYGEANGVEWRWIEHTAWILFENLVLILGVTNIKNELREMAYSRFLLMAAREEALHLSSVKSNFLSNMSHEIRTPLNSILGFSEILKDTRLDKEQTEYVETIQRCSDTLLHLINDILDISKIENGLLQLDHHSFSLKDLHDDIHKMFSIRCMEKGLQLELAMDQQLPLTAVGDSYRLRQVLTNLVNNAVKFTEAGIVRVEVKKDPTSRMYIWEVSDTGKGIHSDNIKKLFRNFYQEDPSIPRHYGGSGLGLMISKNLIELMGGQIFVRSQVGEGTTFSFTLPLDDV